MKHITLIFLLSCFTNSFCQTNTTIYFFAGQGSDKRIFDSLAIDSSYQTKFIEYDTPPKNATIKSYAKYLSTKIDTSQNFILVGVSLGGMLCAELNEIINPEKVIIISSAKNRYELPFRYKFQRAVPLYKIFPSKLLLLGAKLMQPIVEPDRRHNKKVFKSMLKAKNPLYVKRTIQMIMTWDRTNNTKKIYHIHGTNDHTVPIRNIVLPNIIIKHGSHMMTLTRAKEISQAINQILKEK